MKIHQRAVSKASGLALLALCSTSIYAASITGQVNINGTVGVSSSAINFYSDAGQACGIGTVNTVGCFGINNPRSGDFSSLALGYQITPLTPGNFIKDLNGGPAVGSFFLSEFMIFTNGVKLDLTRLLPGTGANCATSTAAQLASAGFTCTLPSSPFTLQNSNASSDGIVRNSAVFFNVELLGYTGLSSTGNSNYTGAFSTQSAGSNIAGVLARIQNGETVEASYSANFTGTPNNPIPEPGTLGTLGIGLAAIVLGGIRRKARSVK